MIKYALPIDLRDRYHVLECAEFWQEPGLACECFRSKLSEREQS